MNSQSCSRCRNSESLSLVSVPYDSFNAQEEDVQEGRLLVYCSSCVNETFGTLYLTIPIKLVTYDGLVALYKLGYTSSDPEILVNGILGFEQNTTTLNDINPQNKSALISYLQRLS